MVGRPKTGNNFVFRQIGFTPEQDKWLDEQSEKTAASRSDIVRAAIDKFISDSDIELTIKTVLGCQAQLRTEKPDLRFAMKAYAQVVKGSPEHAEKGKQLLDEIQNRLAVLADSPLNGYCISTDPLTTKINEEKRILIEKEKAALSSLEDLIIEDLYNHCGASWHFSASS